MSEQLRRYWPVVVVVALGATFLLVMNLTLGGESMVWTGAIVGVLVGVVIAAMSQRGANQSTSTSRASRKRRK